MDENSVTGMGCCQSRNRNKSPIESSCVPSDETKEGEGVPSQTDNKPVPCTKVTGNGGDDTSESTPDSITPLVNKKTSQYGSNGVRQDQQQQQQSKMEGTSNLPSLAESSETDPSTTTEPSTVHTEPSTEPIVYPDTTLESTDPELEPYCEPDSGQHVQQPHDPPSPQRVIPKQTASYFSYTSLENERYSLNDPPYPDHHNEDRVFCMNEPKVPTVLAVFDGHDGGKASSFADQFMYQRFCSHEVREALHVNPINTLYNLFLDTEEEFFHKIKDFIHEKEAIQSGLPANITSYQAYMFYPAQVTRLQEIEPELAGGTTAVIAVIVDGYLHVANVGDSRAVLVRNTGTHIVFEQLSTDHSVENKEELDRLAALGLDVEVIKRNGRLGSQENTRCIGDYSIKIGYKDVDVLKEATGPPGLADPSITHPIAFDGSFQYLILMSDGVYKSLESLTHPPNTDTMPILLQLIKDAESRTSLKDVSAEVLEDIKMRHERTYLDNASVDPRSPLAVQCRKRDDMSLVVLCFGQ